MSESVYLLMIRFAWSSVLPAGFHTTCATSASERFVNVSCALPQVHLQLLLECRAVSCWKCKQSRREAVQNESCKHASLTCSAVVIAPID